MSRIERLLIANRGEIARRVIRTAHRMGIDTVAVHSDADARALHVREATHSIALGGNASADTYLRIDKLLDAARQSGADAVHPGYGFLSENADFAQAVADAGLTWVGPPADAIRKLGSKSSAKRIAHKMDVPCLPGYQGDDQSDDRFANEAARIGFPVMVKAAAGGGGRGMRLVSRSDELLAALHSARTEAQSAFASGELLLERALLAPRHVEVQVFADAYGHCMHFGERDCSVQRRHQKLIEETPSPAVGPTFRARMGECAVRLAKAAGYVGAGTVEFLVEGSEFYLMEMNTRLQVEHPVTEMVTGLDLVEWQLRVAQGEPLPPSAPRFTGHAIEVRICAEDDSFHPQAGKILSFGEPPVPHAKAGYSLRFDHAIEQGCEVPPFYDSMLGKLIVHAPSRDEAIDRLATALDRLCILGIPTNRGFLAGCLRHPGFRRGEALIPFIAQHADAIRERLISQERSLVAAVMPGLVRGAQASSLAMPFARPLRVHHRGETLDVSMRDSQEDIEGLRSVRVSARRYHAQVGGTDLRVDDVSFDPVMSADAARTDEVRAPFNGKVIAVKVDEGARVTQGESLVIIESMKLEHSLAASRDGIVRTVHVEVGQQAATSQVLVTLEPAS